MYSIVEVSGHQYKVQAGTLFDVQKLDAKEGDLITLDKVLFVGVDEEHSVGKPTVEGAQVKAKVLKHDKSNKVRVFKRMPGKWQKQKGHRQEFTTLLVTELTDGKGNNKEIDKDSKEAKKFLV